MSLFYVRSTKRINNELKLPSEVRVQQSSRTYTRTLSCFRFMLMLRPSASGGANRRSEASNVTWNGRTTLASGDFWKNFCRGLFKEGGRRVSKIRNGWNCPLRPLETSCQNIRIGKSKEFAWKIFLKPWATMNLVPAPMFQQDEQSWFCQTTVTRMDYVWCSKKYLDVANCNCKNV